MNLFTLLKYLHILSAIIGIGVNATYSIWLARATKNPETLAFTLKTVKLLDDRMANPAYVLLLLTGLGMAYTVPFRIDQTPWLLSGLILYVIVSILGIFVYSPTLRRQIALAESDGPSSETYKTVANRGTVLGAVIGVIALSIVYLMVAKPPLWGG